MPQIEKEEIQTPLRGLSDVHISGQGIADLSEVWYNDQGEPRREPKASNYIDVTLSFHDETAFLLGSETEKENSLWAEITLSNNEDGLSELGYTKEEIAVVIEISEKLLSLLRPRIKRGGIYGRTAEEVAALPLDTE